MAHEGMEGWMNQARELAQADRELKIERWVRVTIEIRNNYSAGEVLHTYDLPESMYERWQWLFEWRRAKMVCRYPRKRVWIYTARYDKRTGLDTGAKSLLGSVAAAKAQITRMERIIERYITEQTRNNLFFDIHTDEQLLKAKEKLQRKKENYEQAQTILRAEVAKFKNNPNMYKLFLGLKNLGEFDSILEAKQFAQRSGLAGAFNLLGDRYRDSWYVSEAEAEQNRKKYEDEKNIN